MSFPRRQVVPFVCLLLAFGCGGGMESPATVAGSPSQAVQHAPSGGPAAEQVTLVRDGFGVAHVFAKSDKGALYGAGYAAAEDRLFQMVRARLMCQGREAEFFGPGQVVDPKTGKITNTAIRHDREARAVGWWRHAQRVVAELPLDTLRLLQAYSDGVNAYVASPGAVLHPFFVQFGVPIEDWQPVDCIAVCLAFGRHFATSGLDEDYRLHEWQKLLANPALSYEQTLELMQGDRVCDDDAAVVKQSDVPIALQAAMSDYARQLGLDPSLTCPQIVDGPKFSQAWVVSGARTSSGNAMLVGDPRLEVFLPNALYEWSMHGKTISVRGAGIAGTPLILSGSTPRVAWSPTAIGTDQADLLLLTTDPVSHPGQYLLDGKWRKYAVDELEELKVFGSVHETVRYRETRWGPVVTAVSSNAKPGEEYALMRVPLMDPAADSTPAFFALYRAQDVDDVDQVLAGWAWPPVNLVFGDADGRIGYSVVGALPVRNPALDLAGIVAQDGSRSDSAWIDLVPHALRPHVLDPLEGALFSANHMPVGSWYPIPMRFGTGSAGDTPRSRRLRELLPPWLQGLTPLDVLAPHHDVVNVAYRDLTLLGLHLRDQQGYAYSGSAKAALGELEGWLVAGARMDNAHRATALAAQLDLSFRKGALTDPLIAEYGSSQNGLMLFLETKLAGLRASPPVPLDADTAAFLDGLFRDAWNVMKAVGPPASWQAWYAANHLRLDLEIWRTLEGLPSLRPGHPVPFGPMRVTDGQTLLSTSGQSYTQLVELDGFDSAASVLPPGVSEHESSLHASDQVPLWEGDMLKPSPLTQQGLKASGPTRISQLCYDPAP